MRQSVSHTGSFFFVEMWRMVSSLKPGGVDSDSTSVTKPYLYSCLTRLSIVSVAVGIKFFIWLNYDWFYWFNLTRQLFNGYFLLFAQSGQRPWTAISNRSALNPRGSSSDCAGRSTSTT